MKKFMFVVVVLMGAFFFFWGRDLNKIEVIRVGTECDYAPQNWEEDRQTNSNVPLANKEGFYAEGYDIQVAKFVAGALGAKLEVKKIAWSDLLPALNRREIDAVFSGMLDTAERREVAAFTTPYEVKKTEYAVVVNTKSRYVVRRRIDDFAGASFIAQAGTNLDAAIDQIPGAVHMPGAETVPETLAKVINNEVDGLVIDVDAGRSYEKTYPNLKLIRFPEGHGFTIGYTGVCAAVRKKDTHLLEKINGVLSSLSPRDRQRLMDATVAREWENLRQY